MSDLREKPPVDWTSIDTQIRHDGKQITLPADPENMPLRTAINTLERIAKDEEQPYRLSEVVIGAPWDALVAIYRAMQVIYGVVSPQSTPTFFGPRPPQFVSIKVGPGSKDVIHVPIGDMALPLVEDRISIGFHHNGTTWDGAQMAGTVKRRDRSILVDIANKAREIMRTSSIYKGKAVNLRVEEDGTINTDDQPVFMDLSEVKLTDMIHTAETEALIEANILAPLMHTDACRRNKIPLKRGILLEGKYGTGKSLTARVTAKVAIDNGWTFINLSRAQGLRSAIEFARTYQPALIFAEDIDRAGDRDDDSVNDLINTLDGIVGKNDEIMVVLTTNFVEQIDKALLRPGRFDAVISIQVPDPETVERLVRAYARGLLPPDEQINEVGAILDGQIPATIREVVERAKLTMLMRSRDRLSAQDLKTSASGMKRHLDLLNKEEDEETVADRLYSVFEDLFAKAHIGADASRLFSLAKDAGVEAAYARKNAGAALDVIRDVQRTVEAGAAAAKVARDNTFNIGHQVGADVSMD